MKDNKNMAIVDTTDIKHIIYELRLITTRILPGLINKDNSLYSVLSELCTLLEQKTKIIYNLNERSNYFDFCISNNEKNLTDTVKMLAKIEEPLSKAIKDFNRLTNQSEDNELLDKYKKLLNLNISSINDNFARSLKREYDSLENKINSEFGIINKSIENSMKKNMEKIDSEFTSLNMRINRGAIKIDSERLTTLNKSILESLNNINAFKDSVKKLQERYFILIAVSSFFGGAFIFSIFTWMIIHKLSH